MNETTVSAILIALLIAVMWWSLSAQLRRQTARLIKHEATSPPFSRRVSDMKDWTRVMPNVDLFCRVAHNEGMKIVYESFFVFRVEASGEVRNRSFHISRGRAIALPPEFVEGVNCSSRSDRKNIPLVFYHSGDGQKLLGFEMGYLLDPSAAKAFGLPAPNV